jgi:transcription elongation factor GreA
MADIQETQKLSRAAHDRLQAELDELTGPGRKQIAERLQRARELGDLSENAEYHETKDKQGMMEARIAKIESILRKAEIVEGPVMSDTAVPGMIVTIRMSAGDEERYLLAETKEEHADDVYTVTLASPLGQALNGKRVGEFAEWKGSNEAAFRAELIKLEPWQG